MSNDSSIKRTASGQALQDLMVHLSSTTTTFDQRAQLAEQSIDRWLGTGDEANIIARGRRLLERNLALPVNWHRMRIVVGNRLTQTLQKRSPLFNNATTLIAKANFEAAVYRGLDVTLDNIEKQLTHGANNCFSDVRDELRQELSDDLLPQVLAFMYAARLSAPLLQSILDHRAYEATRINDIMTDKLGPVLQIVVAPKEPLPPLSEEDNQKLARVKQFLEVVNPSLLELCRARGPVVEEYAQRNCYLVIADAYSTEEMNRIEAFFKTPDGQSFRQVIQETMLVMYMSIQSLIASAFNSEACSGEANEGSEDDSSSEESADIEEHLIPA